jgi:hypothetical protein
MFTGDTQPEYDHIKTCNMHITKTSQTLTSQHYYMSSIDKWICEKITTDVINFCVVYQFYSTVDNSVVRMVFGFAK